MRLLLESSKIAFKALFSNKLRSSLTILGVVISVITIAGLLAIALGVRKEISKQIEDLGSNLIAVVPGQITSGGGFNPASAVGASTLTQEDFKSIEEELPTVQNPSMLMPVTGAVRTDKKISKASLIFAVTEKSLPILNIEMKTGRFLSQHDLKTNSRVVVLGSTTSEKLFPNQNPINKTVNIRGEEFKVIGLLRKKPTAELIFSLDFNDSVAMPITTGWEITGVKQIFRIMMQAPDSDSVTEVQEKVKSILLKNHGGEEDFSVLTQDDILGIIGNILNILTTMLAAIAAISLVVGGIGIMNIMLVSVTERTKEIGIRKAVGATNGHILAQFLIESVVLSLFGGVLGVLIAGIGTLLAAKYSPLPVSLSPIIVVLSLGFSALVGIIFGVAPAMSAARKDPIQALRSE